MTTVTVTAATNVLHYLAGVTYTIERTRRIDGMIASGVLVLLPPEPEVSDDGDRPAEPSRSRRAPAKPRR